MKTTRGAWGVPKKEMTLAVSITDFGAVVVKKFTRHPSPRDDLFGAMTTYRFDIRAVTFKTVEGDRAIGEVILDSSAGQPLDGPGRIETQIENREPKMNRYGGFHCNDAEEVVQALLKAKAAFE